MIVVASDWHYPFIYESAYKEFLKFCKEKQPQKIFLAGDQCDMWEISRFSKVPRYGANLKDELDGLKEELVYLRYANKEAEIFYIFGNHEFRLQQYLINRAPELMGIIPSLRVMLGLEELKIKSIETRKGATRFVDTFVREEDILIGHFDKSLKEPGATVRMLMNEKSGLSIVQAHTHKQALIYKRDIEGKVKFGVECGCLCRLDAPFSSETNYNAGFLIIDNGKPQLINLS